jgi:8-oxo-dGTP diphosphatase
MNGPFLPGISIDCVIFGFHDNQLKILLTRFKNTDLYALPGGFIGREENITQAAGRILLERTGLQDIYLEQFHVFGHQDRCPPEQQRQLLESIGILPGKQEYRLGRFISIGYYALIDFTRANPTPDSLSDYCGWWALDSIPSLIFDHSCMTTKALETLRLTLNHREVGLNLLPDTFTMNELQALHETILNEKLVRSNFQRKMLATGLLDRFDKKHTGGAHKAPYLYRFKSADCPR